MNEAILKFIRFGAVGVSGIAVDFMFTFFFKENLKVQKYLANAVGFTAAVTSNYCLNRIWTFRSHNPHLLNEYLIFLAVALVGLGINSLSLMYLVGKKKSFYLSKLIAIAVTMNWNFGANVLITFS